MPHSNLAARAGRWSAQHRKKAILGWLAFVVLAFVLGGAIGQKQLADEDMGNGSSKTADQAVAKADFPDQASEQVLVQARKGQSATDPAFKAGSATSSRAEGREQSRRSSRPTPRATRARSPRTATPR